MKFEREAVKGILSRFAASAVSAVLLVAAFSGRETFDVFFALAPMLLVARLCRPRVAFRWWFLFGLAFWMVSLSWMPAIVKNGGPWPLVILGQFALAAYSALYFAVFGAAASFARERGGAAFGAIVAEPVAWAGLEWVRGHLFGGFAWNFLGAAAAGYPLATAPARLGGVYLVSALAMAMNGVVASVLERGLGPMFALTCARRGWRARLERLAVTGVPLAAILVALHYSRFAHLNPAAVARIPVKAALAQRNFPCVFKAGALRQDPVEAYTQLLANASLVGPDLVVMPESATCEFGADALHAQTFAALRRIAGNCSLHAAFLAGGDCRLPDPADPAKSRLYNAAVLYPAGANGTPGIYMKQHLVPFGEFIPLDKRFPALQKLCPLGVSLYPGEPKLLDLVLGAGPAIKLAPLICFEDTDPDLARVAARKGAHLFAFITNDSWFSGSQEAEAHFRQAVLRCVETGIPALRTGNSGVTGVIRPSGYTEILSDADGKPLVDAAGVMTSTISIPAFADLSPAPSVTPYVRYGDWPLLASALASLGVFAALSRVRSAHALI